MSVDVTAAVLDRLSQVLPADVTVYDGSVHGTPPLRYVIVYGDSGARASSTADGASRDQSYTVQTTSVVVEPWTTPECRWLAAAVRDALTDWRPQADGVVTGQFEHRVSRRPVPDESVADRHVMVAVDQFSLLADHL